jgi:hypothetical protein
VSAASSALRAVIEALEIVGLVIVSAAGLGMLALLAVAGVRVRRRMLAGHPVRAVVAASAEPVGEAARAEIPARVVPALPRADVSALPRIDIQPHVVTSREIEARCPYVNCHHNHPELLPYWRRRREEDDRDG